MINKPVELEMFSKESLFNWIKDRTYAKSSVVGSKAMQAVEEICNEARHNVASVRAVIMQRYAASAQRRGLMSMEVRNKENNLVLGHVMVATALEGGSTNEVFVAAMRVNLLANPASTILRKGGMPIDDFRAWLTAYGFYTSTGEHLWMKVVEQLIERDCYQPSLMFKQGNYRRRPGMSPNTQFGILRIDACLSDESNLIASFDLRTEWTPNGDSRREVLLMEGFKFSFNEAAFTQPEEARNMNTQDNAAQAANMVQAGPKLDFISPITGAQLLEDFSKWVKDNAHPDAATTVDSILKLAMKSEDDHFELLPESFGDLAKHPSLDELIRCEASYGTLVVGVFSPKGERVSTITLAIGTLKQIEGWKEIIVGLNIETTVEETPAMPSNPAPVAEKFRPSSFRSTSDANRGTALKQLPSRPGMMNELAFTNWFLNNASSKEGLDQIEALRRIILDSSVLKNRNPALDLGFFVTVPLHASQMPAVVGDMDPNISGYCDITVVEKVREDAQERRQVALFSFTTLPVLPKDGGLTQLREMLASYIDPAKRGVAAVEFDSDQVFTFHQFSELFKQFDTDGAGRLDAYQLEVRAIMRRLYNKEPGNLYLKGIRSGLPYQHNNGAVVAGSIEVQVYDSYQTIDQKAPLLTFRLITGLASDMFVNRYVEIIQACECDAADELNRQMADAKEEARIRTLETVGLKPGDVVTKPVHAVKRVETSMSVTATTFKTASFAFFRGTITGLFPLMQPLEVNRVEGFVDFLANEYHLEGDNHEVFEVTYLDHDHIAIVVTEKDKVAFCLDLPLV